MRRKEVCTSEKRYVPQRRGSIVKAEAPTGLLIGFTSPFLQPYKDLRVKAISD